SVATIIFLFSPPAIGASFEIFGSNIAFYNNKVGKTCVIIASKKIKLQHFSETENNLSRGVMT
ncbi:hypothetical protein ACYT7O_11005, partial [Streptococcus pyogenes]